MTDNEQPTDSRRDSRLAHAVELRGADQADQARTELLALAAEYPDDVEIAFQTAWVHDTLGLEAEAVPFYERSLAAPGLEPADRASAYVGFGSTYRVLGRYADAVATLRRGLTEFPGHGAMRAFLALALYNTGDFRESVGILLNVIAETSDDADIRPYRRAIAFYADDPDAVT